MGASPLYLLREPQLFAAFVIAVIAGITFHEFSHAAVATLTWSDHPVDAPPLVHEVVGA